MGYAPSGSLLDNLYAGLSAVTKLPHPLAAANAALSPTPEWQILQGYMQQHQDQSKRMFQHSAMEPVKRYLFGHAYPRTINQTAAHSAAAREASGEAKWTFL
jgi:hypothetical protein